jgi:host factor-I protein
MPPGANFLKPAQRCGNLAASPARVSTFQGIIMSDGKPAPQNIQDAFLNTVRREKTTVTIYLVNGAKLTGRIRSFDKFSLLLETGAHEQLVFKHAVSTISQSRRGSGDLRPQVSAELSALEPPPAVVNQPVNPTTNQAFDQPRDSPDS